jgi:hypothetical protein
MRQYERSGVIVDQCTDCRGIFLDMGELEHLAAAQHSWQTAQHQPKEQEEYEQHHKSSHGYDDRDHRDHRPKKKHRSVFEELFD